MSYIFLDESGDLGFDFTKVRTSQYFVITLLFAKKKRPLEKVIRVAHKGLRKKYRMRSDVLHAFHEEPATCTRVIKKLAEKDCSIMTIYLNKKKVYTHFQDEKQVLYNYVVNILLDRIMTRRLIPVDGPIELVASRRETNKFFNENFRQYLERQILDHHQLNLTVKIKTPSEEKVLQAVDFASWAIFRKYEYKDDTYYQLLKESIVEEMPLFS